jgi:hypothetical protein
MSAERMTCPQCGAGLHQTRRGATLAKRGPSFVCPMAQREVTRDERGHRVWAAGARHSRLRVWNAAELAGEDEP